MKNEKTYELVLTALFTAIIVIMAFKIGRASCRERV